MVTPTASVQIASPVPNRLAKHSRNRIMTMTLEQTARAVNAETLLWGDLREASGGTEVAVYRRGGRGDPWTPRGCSARGPVAKNH